MHGIGVTSVFADPGAPGTSENGLLSVPTHGMALSNSKGYCSMRDGLGI